jgi:hypothetical protein
MCCDYSIHKALYNSGKEKREFFKNKFTVISNAVRELKNQFKVNSNSKEKGVIPHALSVSFFVSPSAP